MKFTLESIGMIAFGVKLGALQKERYTHCNIQVCV